MNLLPNLQEKKTSLAFFLIGAIKVFSKKKKHEFLPGKY